MKHRLKRQKKKKKIEIQRLRSQKRQMISVCFVAVRQIESVLLHTVAVDMEAVGPAC